MRSLVALLLAACLALAARPSSAHLNSPHEHREAMIAGHHAVMVVHLPPAVPGEADARLRLLDLAPDERVEVLFRQIPPQGEARAPAWQPAERSDVDPASWRAPMPLMVFGLFEAEFLVRSPRGEGSLRVPVTARNPTPASMPVGVVSALVALSSFLVVTAFLIARAVVVEGRPAAGGSRRGLVAGIAAAGAFAGFVTFTGITWRTMHLHFLARATPPLVADWVVESGSPRAGRPVQALVLLTDRDGGPAPRLLASAGEPVHVTVISQPGAEHVEHAHAQPDGAGRWRVAFTPHLPGRHLVLVDAATREAGELTIVQELVAGPAVRDAQPLIPVTRAPAALPPVGGAGAGAAAGDIVPGWSVAWAPVPPLVAGEVVMIGAEVTGGADGAAGGAEGAAGGAELIVVREDMQVADRLQPSEAGAGLRFAYGFPRPGRYRLALAVPAAGTSAIGALDVDVAAP